MSYSFNTKTRVANDGQPIDSIIDRLAAADNDITTFTAKMTSTSLAIAQRNPLVAGSSILQIMMLQYMLSREPDEAAVAARAFAHFVRNTPLVIERMVDLLTAEALQEPDMLAGLDLGKAH